MNEAKAIELATENLITVTTDVRTKNSVSFKVGPRTIFQTPGARLWSVDGERGLHTRGNAILVAVNSILSDN